MKLGSRQKLLELAGWGKQKSRIHGAILIILTGVVFYILFRKIDLNQVVRYLKVIPPKTWGCAALITFSFPLISAVRWHLIFKTMGYEVSLKRCFVIIVGVWPLSSISPSKSGDLLKASGLRKEVGLTIVAGSVLTERVLDMLILAFFALIGGVVFNKKQIILIAISVLILIFGIMILAQLNMKWPVGEKLQEKIRMLFQSLRIVARSPLLLAPILALTALNWFASVFQTKLLFAGIGVEVPILFVAAALPIAIFVGLLPITLGGMGTRDSAMVVFFSSFATAPQALAVALLYSFFGYWLLSVVGIPFIRKALDL